MLDFYNNNEFENLGFEALKEKVRGLDFIEKGTRLIEVSELLKKKSAEHENEIHRAELNIQAINQEIEQLYNSKPLEYHNQISSLSSEAEKLEKFIVAQNQLIERNEAQIRELTQMIAADFEAERLKLSKQIQESQTQIQITSKRDLSSRIRLQQEEKLKAILEQERKMLHSRGEQIRDSYRNFLARLEIQKQKYLKSQPEVSDKSEKDPSTIESQFKNIIESLKSTKDNLFNKAVNFESGVINNQEYETLLDEAENFLQNNKKLAKESGLLNLTEDIELPNKGQKIYPIIKNKIVLDTINDDSETASIPNFLNEEEVNAIALGLSDLKFKIDEEVEELLPSTSESGLENHADDSLLSELIEQEKKPFASQARMEERQSAKQVQTDVTQKKHFSQEIIEPLLHDIPQLPFSEYDAALLAPTVKSDRSDLQKNIEVLIEKSKAESNLILKVSHLKKANELLQNAIDDIESEKNISKIRIEQIDQRIHNLINEKNTASYRHTLALLSEKAAELKKYTEINNSERQNYTLKLNEIQQSITAIKQKETRELTEQRLAFEKQIDLEVTAKNQQHKAELKLVRIVKQQHEKSVAEQATRKKALLEQSNKLIQKCKDFKNSLLDKKNKNGALLHEQYDVLIKTIDNIVGKLDLENINNNRDTITSMTMLFEHMVRETNSSAGLQEEIEFNDTFENFLNNKEQQLNTIIQSARNDGLLKVKKGNFIDSTTKNPIKLSKPTEKTSQHIADEATILSFDLNESIEQTLVDSQRKFIAETYQITQSPEPLVIPETEDDPLPSNSHNSLSQSLSLEDELMELEVQQTTNNSTNKQINVAVATAEKETPIILSRSADSVAYNIQTETKTENNVRDINKKVIISAPTIQKEELESSNKEKTNKPQKKAKEHDDNSLQPALKQTIFKKHTKSVEQVSKSQTTPKKTKKTKILLKPTLTKPILRQEATPITYQSVCPVVSTYAFAPTMSYTSAPNRQSVLKEAQNKTQTKTQDHFRDHFISKHTIFHAQSNPIEKLLHDDYVGKKFADENLNEKTLKKALDEIYAREKDPIEGRKMQFIALANSEKYIDANKRRNEVFPYSPASQIWKWVRANHKKQSRTQLAHKGILKKAVIVLLTEMLEANELDVKTIKEKFLPIVDKLIHKNLGRFVQKIITNSQIKVAEVLNTKGLR